MELNHGCKTKKTIKNKTMEIIFILSFPFIFLYYGSLILDASNMKGCSLQYKKINFTFYLLIPFSWWIVTLIKTIINIYDK